MPSPFRFILLLCAALCGGFVALLGGGFSRAVEPESYSNGTSAFWLLAGAVVAAPLWVPAVFPSRYPIAFKFCRWVSAATLLLPTLLFGSIVVHNIRRSVSGLGATSSALVVGAVLTVACLGCMVVLLWPELRSQKQRAT
jgi:hypothetical protein